MVAAWQASSVITPRPQLSSLRSQTLTKIGTKGRITQRLYSPIAVQLKPCKAREPAMWTYLASSHSRCRVTIRLWLLQLPNSCMAVPIPAWLHPWRCEAIPRWVRLPRLSWVWTEGHLPGNSTVGTHTDRISQRRIGSCLRTNQFQFWIILL